MCRRRRRRLGMFLAMMRCRCFFSLNIPAVVASPDVEGESADAAVVRHLVSAARCVMRTAVMGGGSARRSLVSFTCGR